MMSHFMLIGFTPIIWSLTAGCILDQVSRICKSELAGLTVLCFLSSGTYKTQRSSLKLNARKLIKIFSCWRHCIINNIGRSYSYSISHFFRFYCIQKLNIHRLHKYLYHAVSYSALWNSLWAGECKLICKQYKLK